MLQMLRKHNDFQEASRQPKPAPTHPHTSRPSPLLRRSRHAPWPALFPCSSEPAFAEASGFCKNRLLQLTHASATEFKPASAGSNPPPCATPKQVWTLAATGERTGTRSADGQGAASPLHQASPRLISLAPSERPKQSSSAQHQVLSSDVALAPEENTSANTPPPSSFSPGPSPRLLQKSPWGFCSRE